MPSPKKYQKLPVSLKAVEECGKLGMTQEQTANSLGISYATLHRRKAEDARIERAYLKGRGEGIATLSKKLFQLAEAGEMPALKLYLQTVAAWHSQQKNALELKIKTETPSINIHLTPPSTELKTITGEVIDNAADQTKKLTLSI